MVYSSLINPKTFFTVLVDKLLGELLKHQKRPDPEFKYHCKIPIELQI